MAIQTTRRVNGHTIHRNLGARGARCPYCGQQIGQDVEKISARIAKAEQTLKDKVAREQQQAIAKAQAEMEKAKTDAAAQIEKTKREAAAQEAAIRQQATKAANAAVAPRIVEAVNAEKQRLYAENLKLTEQLEDMNADSDEVAWAIRDDVARDYEMMSPGFGARWHQYFWQQLVASQAWFGQRSVASVSARRVDGEEIVEIEISNRLQRLAGWQCCARGRAVPRTITRIRPVRRRARRRRRASAGRGCGGRRRAGSGSSVVRLPGQCDSGLVARHWSLVCCRGFCEA